MSYDCHSRGGLQAFTRGRPGRKRRRNPPCPALPCRRVQYLDLIAALDDNAAVAARLAPGVGHEGRHELQVELEVLEVVRRLDITAAGRHGAIFRLPRRGLGAAALYPQAQVLAVEQGPGARGRRRAGVGGPGDVARSSDEGYGRNGQGSQDQCTSSHLGLLRYTRNSTGISVPPVNRRSFVGECRVAFRRPPVDCARHPAGMDAFE